MGVTTLSRHDGKIEAASQRSNSAASSEKHSVVDALDGVSSSVRSGFGDHPYTRDEPEALRRLKGKHPELEDEMDSAWRSSFQGRSGKVRSDRREIGLLVFEDPSGEGPLRFMHYSAQENEGGYKEIDFFGDFSQRLKESGIPVNWNLVVVFHTHPFDFCGGMFCGRNSAPGFGPSDDDYKMTRDWPWGKDPTINNTLFVLREIVGADYKYDGSHVDLYYGKTAK
jgi:hypothetical protein